MASDNKSVLFISHDLDELVQTCDAVTVLRDGNIIGTLDKDEMDINVMRTMMVGRELQENYYRSDYDGSYSDEVVAVMKDVATQILEDVSLELHKGEILGIGGLTESGIHDVGRVLYALDRPISGSATIKGKTVTQCDKCVDMGIGYVSKNRDQEALMLRNSIRANIVMPSLKRLRKFGLISNKAEREVVDAAIKQLEIKCASADQPVDALSGGNKQKVSFAKWIGNRSDILILDCPTRGVDVGVKAAMYQLIYDLKMEGKAILLISEELPELIGMSDRILIIKNGKISKEFQRSESLSEHDIIHEMI